MVTIRPAEPADIEAIAELITQLGYPTLSEGMANRLRPIFEDGDYASFVALVDEKIAGFIGTRTGPYYERDGLHGQIMVLSVDENYRGQGIGRALMAAAEEALQARGVKFIIVTTANHRAGAHRFYEHLGYDFTGRRYMKSF